MTQCLHCFQLGIYVLYVKKRLIQYCMFLQIVGQGPAVLAAGAGQVGYIFFNFSSIFPF